ncbi:ATP-dependent helicase HrpB [Geothermobacter ehrlichii]|uniref:ATP-dependent helicase HrpB n=1 Tax=Geothermobacter ehrlichii TaxID=213224 RepID=A0A5D3WME4_9BACT|nr:ATP-dependent helicase HrpB [Geothermobacter ehrlichii]TYO98716.1 ATP-dependent helicase HrpB [Geothermobacter ehrlichii]
MKEGFSRLPSLPVDEALPRLDRQLAGRPLAILQAEPGAGKTTRVPLALLDASWLAGRGILLLEPRRLAAVCAARYMAGLLGEEVGETVGYSVRYQRRVSARTRIEVVTEGVLTRRLQQDPELADIGLVIFDEFHERQLQSDLGLALCRDIQAGLRPDLRLLIMSATLDADRLSRALGDAPVIACGGRQHPVDCRYRPERVGDAWPQLLPAVVRQAVDETVGDVLVFLPGRRQIERLATELAPWAASRGLLLAPLHGGLDLAAQNRALQPGDSRKLVLATNVAETSLTIEGVRVVVDSGFERRPRFEPSVGLTRLETVRISRASARQRAGRAGRLGPGVCYRLWSRGEEAEMLDAAPPEIRQADLAPLLLELLAWGVADPAALEWVDPPPASGLRAARELLERLAAIDNGGRLTSVGRRMSRHPCHPRLARLLVEAEDRQWTALGADLAALLSEVDFRRLPRGDGGRRACDVRELLEWLAVRRDPSLARARNYWRRRLGVGRDAGDACGPDAVGHLLATAFPDRIGRRREGGADRYLLASGRAARLAPWSMAGQSEWLVAVEVAGGEQEATITIASPLSEEVVHELRERVDWEDHLDWDADGGRLVSCRRKRFGALVLQQRPGEPDPERAVALLLGVVRRQGLRLLDWNDEVAAFCARVRLLSKVFGEDVWPPLTESWLLQHLERWLAPGLYGVRDAAGLRRVRLQPLLQGLLAGGRLRELERLAPERMEIPSGRRARIDYLAADEPVLAAKLQELFGWRQTPRIADGRVALVIHLLSPAGRPLQVTRDLASFWRNGYPEVRREMRGRYPKHPWPEDPLTAEATARVRHAKRR